MTVYCDTSFAQAELFTRFTPDQGWRTVDLVHVASAIPGEFEHVATVEVL